jgi:hypothetical protein
VLPGSAYQTADTHIQLLLLRLPAFTIAKNPGDDGGHYSRLADTGSTNPFTIQMDLECEHDV